jgi:hypothetical protein
MLEFGQCDAAAVRRPRAAAGARTMRGAPRHRRGPLTPRLDLAQVRAFVLAETAPGRAAPLDDPALAATLLAVLDLAGDAAECAAGGTEPVLRSGELLKNAEDFGLRLRWQRRWCVLTASTLCYYALSPAAEAAARTEVG